MTNSDIDTKCTIPQNTMASGSVVIFVGAHDWAVQYDPKTKIWETLLGWDKNGKEVWEITSK